ncbi:hypothetical protein [Psychroserpens burtonensis]|uniref:hypothetical protein n=1 Tax=Psychroserpens burtonensis TaxID=49278 RepID=UPI0004103574|nr:hypothetical protein [Psychroserpens burtonensis]
MKKLIILFLFIICLFSCENENKDFKVGTFVYLMDINEKILYTSPDYNSDQIETILKPEDFVYIHGVEIVALTGKDTESEGQWLHVNFYDTGYQNKVIKEEGYITSNGLRKISINKNLHFDALEGFYLDIKNNHILHLWNKDEYNIFQPHDGFMFTIRGCGKEDDREIEGSASFSNGKLVLSNGMNMELDIKEMNILSYSEINNPLAPECNSSSSSDDNVILFYPIVLSSNLALINEDSQNSNETK